MGEFDLIARYFTRATRRAALGVGDDCALWQPAPGTQLAISSDMLVEGRHFFATVDPLRLGHKALAVNLSDLAACGAKPLAFTLALALPHADEAWLAAFSHGLLALADAHDCELIGGDTTKGPLNICITVFGEVPVVNGHSQALLRSGARSGDDLYVSGTLGDARLALEVFRASVELAPALFEAARLRMEMPTPRVALGQGLRGIASAAIDISDGLLGDLGHILRQSGVGASVQADAAVSLIATRQHFVHGGTLPECPISHAQWRQFALAGGDDYELLFTAPASQREAVAAAGAASQTAVTRIGQIESQLGVRLKDDAGQALPNSYTSFDHFA